MKRLPRKRTGRSVMIALLVCACATLLLSVSCSSDKGIFDTQWAPDIAGVRASDLLSATQYTSLVVEIQPVEGMQPTQQAIDNLVQFLEARLNKPAGVQVTVNTPLPVSGQSQFSLDQIRQIEEQSRITRPSGQTMAAYFLFVDGESNLSSGNSRILGVAYGATSMVIFQTAIQDLSGGIGEPPRDVLEATVIEHEFGHILGLVDNGSPTVDPGHHDGVHGAHCANSNCLMHYSVETGNVVNNLLGGSAPPLDSDCLNDLASNGGK